MAHPWRAEGVDGASPAPDPDRGPRAVRPHAAPAPPADPPRRWVPRARVAAAWAFVAPVGLWLAVRAAGVGGGTRLETYLVLTPFVAAASGLVLALVVALRVRPALVAAVVCCAGYGLVMAPVFAPGPRPSPAPTGPRLRVMTLNIDDDGADPATIVRTVRARRVDVLALQELTPGFHASLADLGLDELLPYAAAGDPAGSSGSGIYSRHPVHAVAHEVDGVNDNPTVLVAVDGAPAVEVTAVHPVSPVSAAERDDWQGTFRTLPRPDDDGPVRVLVGDFNATVDQPTMRDLLGDGYVDAAGAVGDGWIPTWRRGVSPPLAIDHVLVDRSTGVDRVAVVGVPGTDHRAVVAELRLPSD